jgi:hypothetical protein
MRDTAVTARLTALAVLLTTMICLLSCSGGPERNGDEGDFPPPDQVGAKYLEGRLDLSSLHWPEVSDREGRLTLKNLSETDLRYLTARVVFYFEAPKADVARIASESFSQTFNIYRGEEVRLAFTPKTDREIRSVTVSVEEMKQVATVARAKDAVGRVSPGTTFLDGRLECVRLVEGLTSAPPAMAFTVRNLTAEEIGSVRYKFVLLRRGAVAFETERWMPIPGGFEPGADQVIEPDLEGVTPGFGVGILLIREQI